MAGSLLAEEVFGSVPGKLAALALRGSLARLRRKMDYGERGGAPLVGVDGMAVLCHGASSAHAIKNGLAVAAHLSAGLPAAIAALLAEQAAHTQLDAAVTSPISKEIT